MAYLLLVPAQEVEEERRFRLVVVWVHPCQAYLPMLEEAVRKLALLINTREDLPYTFAQLCKDSQHVPLSSIDHISVMIDGTPSKCACRCLSQLEVCQLLQSETQVVYPEGLNGCLVPIVTSLPASLAHGSNALNDEPTLLQVDFSQFTGEECESKAPIPSRASASTSPAHLAMAHPPKAENHISMTTEVNELLLQAALDTSSQALGSSTLKRPVSAALGAPLSPRQEDSSKPVDTSSQASPWVVSPDDVEPIDQTLKEICTPTTLCS